MKGIKFYVSVMSVAIGVTACGGADQIESKARDELAKLAGNCGQLIQFDKTDGVAGEFMGVQNYQIEYTAKVKLNRACYVNVNSGRGQGLSSIEYAIWSGDASRYLKEPGIFEFKGKMNLAKKEGGWHYDSGGATFKPVNP